jgi:exopolysaccharide biosynthesis polyprenyl glycosylphosphotransferase
MSTIDKQTLSTTKAPLFSYGRIPDIAQKVFLILNDLLVLSVVVLGSQMIGSTNAQDGSQLSLFPLQYEFVVMLIGWGIFASLNDLYDPFRARDLKLVTKNVLITSGLVLAALGFSTLFLLLASEIDVFPTFWTTSSLLAVSGSRLLYASISNAQRFQHRTLILGDGARAQAVTKLTRQMPQLCYEVQGYVREYSDSTETTADGLPIWSSGEKLMSLTERFAIDTIIVATEYTMNEDLSQYLLECQVNGLQVFWLPDFFDKLCHKIPVDHVDPVWMFNAMRQPASRMKLASKQLLDWTLIILALPVLFLLFPLLAILVKLSSDGPIFYRQTRCGYAGKLFTILKFRTMYQDAEKDGKPRWATDSDPRITPIGRILRKSHLDELPQLINILRGEMSLTGPRPERPEFVQELEKQIPFYRTRFLVKPGLTGWAQVKYDYGSSVEDARIKLEYDCHYVCHYSVAFDIYIMFHTISVALQGKGT